MEPRLAESALVKNVFLKELKIFHVSRDHGPGRVAEPRMVYVIFHKKDLLLGCQLRSPFHDDVKSYEFDEDRFYHVNGEILEPVTGTGGLSEEFGVEMGFTRGGLPKQWLRWPYDSLDTAKNELKRHRRRMHGILLLLNNEGNP